MTQLKITLVKSINRAKKDQVATVKALGLTKIRSAVIQKDNDAMRGMIRKIGHLVSVEEIEDQQEKAVAPKAEPKVAKAPEEKAPVVKKTTAPKAEPKAAKAPAAKAPAAKKETKAKEAKTE